MGPTGMTGPDGKKFTIMGYYDTEGLFFGTEEVPDMPDSFYRWIPQNIGPEVPLTTLDNTTALASVIKIGDFIMIRGGILYMYIGAGLGETGPYDAPDYFIWSGDVTDETRMV